MSEVKPEDWLGDAFKEAERELEWVRNDSSDYAKLRRIQLNDALCDAFLGLEKILKDRGDHQNANEARRRADGYWGKVIEESGVYDIKPDDGVSPLTPEEAAELLSRSRGEV